MDLDVIDRATTPDRRTVARARAVTYGLVTVLLAAALVQVDAWPVTAFRLFSSVRSDHGVTLTLVALAPDGHRTVLRRPDDEVVGMTSHRYGDLVGAPEEEARPMVDAWLDLARVDRKGVASVVLERSTWRIDPATGDPTETGRDVVARVTP